MRRIPGSHAPNIKNRSSKHLSTFTKRRSILRCVSNEILEKWSNNGVIGSHAEIKRRAEKRAKKETKTAI